MTYETPDRHDLAIERLRVAGMRQPGQIDVRSIVVAVPDCVSTSLGAIDAGLIATLQDRRFDHVLVSGLPTRVGWGLAKRRVLEGLYAAGFEIEAKDVDISESVIRTADQLPHGMDLLSELFKFVEKSPAVLLVSPHSDEPPGPYASDPGAVLGLLTISDLNHREVRRVAYELLHEVELALAGLLRLEHTDPWRWIDSMSNEDARARLIGYWELLRRRGVDTAPESLLTLPQLLGVAGKSTWIRERLGFKSRSELEASLNGAVELRNRVMHPVRPLISAQEDVTRFVHAARGLEALLAAVERGTAR